MNQQFSKTVYITQEEVDYTPSMEDGYEKEEEVLERMYGCELICDAGILLRLSVLLLVFLSFRLLNLVTNRPQIVLATAQTLLHRFYYTRSLKEYYIKDVAITCIFLAGKIEEHFRRINDVLNVYYRIKQIREGLKKKPLNYNDWYYEKKSIIIQYEQKILHNLGFNVFIEHPHKYLFSYLLILDAIDLKEFKQLSWNILCDSYRLDLSLRFKPEVIATAAIYMAAKITRTPLPENPAWWELFDAKIEEINEIAYYIHNMYKLPKPRMKKFSKSYKY